MCLSPKERNESELKYLTETTGPLQRRIRPQTSKEGSRPFNSGPRMHFYPNHRKSASKLMARGKPFGLFVTEESNPPEETFKDDDLRPKTASKTAKIISERPIMT